MTLLKTTTGKSEGRVYLVPNTARAQLTREGSLAGRSPAHRSLQRGSLLGTVQHKNLRETKYTENGREKLNFSAVTDMVLADLSESSGPGIAQSRSKLDERMWLF